MQLQYKTKMAQNIESGCMFENFSLRFDKNVDTIIVMLIMTDGTSDRCDGHERNENLRTL